MKLRALSDVVAGIARGAREVAAVTRGADWGWPATRGSITPVSPDEWNRGLDAILPPEQMRRPYKESATVYRAVRAIATSGAQLDVEVWPVDAGARVGDEPVVGHWLTRLLRAPSPVLQGDQLVEALLISLETTGECFLWHRDVARDTGGGPTYPHSLWWLDPSSMRPNIVDGELVSWVYQTQTRQVTIPLEELSFLRFHNPYDPIRGLGTLAAAMLEATTEHSATVWNRSSFENSAVPPIVFVPTEAQGDWGLEERTRFLELWNQKYAGKRRAGTAGALPQHLKIEQLKITHAEMEFLSGKRYSREQVLSVFGVPPAIAGVFEYANYANSREQMKFFWHLTMLPKLRYVQDSLSSSLVQRYDPGRAMFFKTDPVLADVAAADFKDKVETGGKLWAMGWSAADVNDRLDLGMPTDGRPWLQRPWLPFSVQPADLVEDEPEPDDGDDDPGADPFDDEGVAEALRRPVRRDVAARRTRWGVLAGLWGDLARSYQRRLRSWMWGLRSDVLRRLAARDDGERRAAVAGRPVTRIAAADVEALLFDLEESGARLKTLSRGAWERAIERGGEALRKEVGVTIDFDHLDPRVRMFVAAKALKIVTIPKRIHDDLRRTLIDGINKGETIRDLAKRVRDKFDVERSGALRIARTETSQAFGFGHYESMRQAGIKRHEWLHSGDDRVRDSHLELETIGPVVVGEDFKHGLKYPGDVDAPPEEVINCRCATVPVVEDGTGAAGAEE